MLKILEKVLLHEALNWLMGGWDTLSRFSSEMGILWKIMNCYVKLSLNEIISLSLPLSWTNQFRFSFLKSHSSKMYFGISLEFVCTISFMLYEDFLLIFKLLYLDQEFTSIASSERLFHNFIIFGKNDAHLFKKFRLLILDKLSSHFLQQLSKTFMQEWNHLFLLIMLS